MTKPKAIIDRAETNAAIDRTMDTLKAIKSQLKAKKLNSHALLRLLDIARDDLRSLSVPLLEQYHADIDELVTRQQIARDLEGDHA